MFVTGIGTATPTQRYSKAECWDAFTRSDWFNRLGPRAHALAQAVLLRDNGIEYRRLAVPSLEEVFAIDPDTLYRRFSEHAPSLAADAAAKALDRAHLVAAQIDAVVVSTCTGYLCPGLSSHVIERLGLRRDAQAFDLVGQGCAAALPNLRLAEALLASERSGHVLSVCVEVCSAAMYLDEDPGVLVSACLFGDGAGAAVLSRRPSERQRRIEWKDALSLTEPGAREALRFEEKDGMLRNILTREVPRLAAGHAWQLLQDALRRNGLERGDIACWIMHAGGRDVLQALEKEFGAASGDFRYSRDALREYGNLSSAFVYFVLKAAADEEQRGGWWWMSSFGAGFSCHGALLAVE